MADSDQRLPRNVYERSCARACARWECMSRNATYRADVCRFVRRAAESHGWDEERFRAHCRAGGGVIDPPSDWRGAEDYASTLARWGLSLLVLPEVKISVEEMAGFPVFVDTPEWQEEVNDRVALCLLSKLTEVGPDDWRPAFRRVRVQPSGFRLAAKRLHHTFQRDLLILDQRSRGKSLKYIAMDIDLPLEAVKAAVARAKVLVGSWEPEEAEEAEELAGWMADVDAHLAQCTECRGLRGRRFCAQLERSLQLESIWTGYAPPRADYELDAIAARLGHRLPAKSSYRKTPTADNDDYAGPATLPFRPRPVAFHDRRQRPRSARPR